MRLLGRMPPAVMPCVITKLLLLSALASVAAAAAEKPNLLLISVDDLRPQFGRSYATEWSPSVPGLRSHAPGRQRVVSPIPISHRRGDPARGEPAGVRCPLPPQSGLASTDATESAPQRQRHACAWRLEGLPVSTAPRPRESRMHAALRWLDLAVR